MFFGVYFLFENSTFTSNGQVTLRVSDGSFGLLGSNISAAFSVFEMITSLPADDLSSLGLSTTSVSLTCYLKLKPNRYVSD